MKIACIATSQVPSNTANSIQVMKACQALAQLGHHVELFVPGRQPRAWDDLARTYGLGTPFTVRWIACDPLWKRYDLAWRAIRLAKAHGAQMVYTWALQAAVLAKTRRLPVLFEAHDRPTGKIGRPLFGAYLRWPGKKRTLLITRALQTAIEREYDYQFPENEAVIGPNGVDLDRYADLPEPPEARRMLGLDDRLTVVYTGHFYAGRGMDLLLSLAGCYPQVQFLWVGGRPEDVLAWKKRVAEAGLHNIRLTGFIDNQKLPLYQAAGEILLMPYGRSIAGSSGGNSAEICSPMKMFEYLATGRAILSSDLPVLHEVLDDRNAVFCPPEDQVAWRQALGALLDDPERIHRLGLQASQDAQRYTWIARAEKALAGFQTTSS